MGGTRLSAAGIRPSLNGGRVSVLPGGRSYVQANVDSRIGIGASNDPGTDAEASSMTGLKQKQKKA